MSTIAYCSVVIMVPIKATGQFAGSCCQVNFCFETPGFSFSFFPSAQLNQRLLLCRRLEIEKVSVSSSQACIKFTNSPFEDEALIRSKT